MAEASGRRLRAVVLVANPAAPYSRGLRIARSLVGAGWEVEIAAQAAVGLPAEERDGEVLIRRHGRTGPWVEKLARRVGRPGLGRRIVMKTYRTFARWSAWARRHPPPTTWDVRNKLLWPTLDRPWWHTLEHDLAPADLYHACGYRALPVALRLGHAAKAAGRAGLVIYDAIDIALESNTFISRHRAWKWLYRRRERAWARQADAVVTVNAAVADVLVWRLGVADRPIIVENMPPRWTPPEASPDLIRRAAGLAPACRVVLYLGRLLPNRGLNEAAEATSRVDRAVLALVGPGLRQDAMRTRTKESESGRAPVALPPVHPDDVPAWAASADVSTVVLPPVSLNQRLSTPNKLWELLAGGTPVVVGRDTIVMRDIVEREGLGVVVDESDPDDYARGLRAILDAPVAERLALRERCRRAAFERYNWETAVQPYLALVERLAPRRTHP